MPTVHPILRLRPFSSIRPPASLTLLFSLAMPAIALAQAELRGDVERELVPIEAAYRAAPGDSSARRAYAEILFKLGNVWQANDVIAPLATPWSTSTAALTLGAQTALLTSDYGRAEALFGRLRDLAGKDSATRATALAGLEMVYYQSNQYAKAKGIDLPENEERGAGSLVTFMKRFAGTPYQIEWANPDHVAHLPIVNDFTKPGALPTMQLEVNGQTVQFILDTGGDRLYIDEGVAKQIGIREIAKRRSRYAYTKGEWVQEPLGVASTVKLGEVTLKNVPVIGAKWKALGQKTDGVITTQILKQFLATVDYTNARITFRERGERGKRQLLESLGPNPVRMPFFMTSTHLMFAKGSLNGHQGMNLLLDSGLAMSMPMVILDETVAFLSLPKNQLPNSKYYWVPLESHGLGSLTRGATQALGNVMVEENAYWRNGFLFDVLLSHQFLWHFGSWTIDFDTMSYWFPAPAGS